MGSRNDLTESVNVLEMNFVELSEYIAELHEQINRYKVEINQYEAMISGWDRDKEIIRYANAASDRAAEARDWRKIAGDLADAMELVEDQLASLGVGLRPVAQTAMRAYLEQIERFESQ